MATASANVAIQDALIANQVDLVKLSEQVRKDVLVVLKELEGDLIKRLAAVDPTAPSLTRFQQQRLTQLLTQVQQITGSGFAKARKITDKTLLKLAELETALASGSVDSALGIRLAIPTLNRQILQEIVKDGLIQGAPSREWWAKQSADLVDGFRREMRLGVLANESVGQLTNRVRDLMGNKRHQAEALARTSTISISNLARLRTYQENAHLIKAIQWVSTLDSRTTDICKGLDGLTWSIPEFTPIGHNVSFPGPTAHWNCRSTQTPVTKSFDELRQTKGPKAAALANKLDAQTALTATRASMDGQVPGPIKYEQWLLLKEASQPGFALTSGALTPTKYALWKQGKLNFKDLIDQSANPITVEELKERLGDVIPATALPSQALAAKTAAAEAQAKKAEDVLAAKVAAFKKAAQIQATEQAQKTIADYQNKATAPSVHHFNALKDLTKAKGGAYITELWSNDPARLVAMVDARAAKKKLSQDLATYKKAAIADKKPSVSAQAAFESLPEEAQKDVLDAITVKKAELAAKAAAEKAAAERTAAILKANEDAAKEMGDILANPKGKVKLAKAIKAIQKDPQLAGLSPAKQLAQAKAKAKAAQAQATKSSFLAEAKKKAFSGEQLSPKQAQTLASLTAEELDVYVAQIGQLKDNIEGYKAAIVGGITPTKAQTKAWKFLNKKGKDIVFADIEKAMAAKKTATAAEATAAAEALAKPEDFLTLSTKTWRKTRPKGKGSVPGVFMQDEAGQEWLVKFTVSDDISRNEVLTAKLYEAAGVDVPDLRLVRLDKRAGARNGGLGVASRVIDGIEEVGPKELARLEGTFDNFTVDAWLADWDVVGLDYDNIVKGPTGKALRIDVGAGLRYRAQGGAKGRLFGDTVGEVDTLRDPSVNLQAAEVFGAIPEAKIQAGAAKVVAISDETLDNIVFSVYDDNEDLAKELSTRLKRRRDDLKARYPGLVSQEVKPTPAQATGARVDDFEQTAIINGRANGYSFRTDVDELEEQQVVVQIMKDKNGKEFTRATFKMRPEAGKRFRKAQLLKSGAVPEIDPDALGLDARIIEAVRGIGALARDGSNIRLKDIHRVGGITSQIMDIENDLNDYIKKGLLERAELEAFQAHYYPWMNALQDAVRQGPENPAVWPPPQLKVFGLFKRGGWRSTPPKTPQVEELPFTWKSQQRPWQYDAATGNKSNMQLTGEKWYFPGENPQHFIGSRGRGNNKVKITHFPYDSNNTFTAEGWTMVDVASSGNKATEEIFKVIDDLGLNSKRATEADLEELFLDRSAFAMSIRNEAHWRQYQKAAGIANQAERIAKKKAWFKVLKVDIEQTPAWQQSKNGIHQAFEGGRFHQLRPDFTDEAMAEFEKTYVLYHNTQGLQAFPRERGTWDILKLIIDSGGQLRSLNERARLGIIPGDTSKKSDMASGGGSYVFLRTQLKRKRFNHVGLFWKPKVARRLDAVSYPGDQFGEVKEGLQRSLRGVTPEDYARHHVRDNNELIFKDGLSIYDDLSHVVFYDRAEWRQAIDWARSNGFNTWTDGRDIEDVFTYLDQKLPLD